MICLMLLISALSVICLEEASRTFSSFPRRGNTPYSVPPHNAEPAYLHAHRPGRKHQGMSSCYVMHGRARSRRQRSVLPTSEGGLYLRAEYGTHSQGLGGVSFCEDESATL